MTALIVVSTGDQLGVLWRLLLALVLGAIIGLERNIQGHEAGIRTQSLVALGACLFSITGAMLMGPGIDPSRIAAQVATGVGFLGAGTILRSGTDIKGLTTAASIWVSAAVGVAVAFDLWLVATAAVVLAVILLLVVRLLQPVLPIPPREEQRP